MAYSSIFSFRSSWLSAVREAVPARSKPDPQRTTKERRSRRIKLAALASRLCPAVALSFPLAALTAPAGDSKLLELPFEDLLQVKISSAGKREEKIRDIPASVTILTREDIQRYGYVTFEELLRNVPGFFVLDTIDERLIGNRGTVGGGVQFLVNGVLQHQTRQKALTIPEIAHFNIPVESIDRIEVIRGPMSTIYGNNAFLGVINVVTNEMLEWLPSLGERGQP